MKKVRFDVLLALLLPLAISIIIKIHNRNFNLIYVYLILILALVSECFFLSENKKDTYTDKDRGLISGFMTSLVLSVLLFIASNLNENKFLKTEIFSIIVISSGVVFRLIAKIELKSAFSHSLRINNDHQLVTTGIYKYIRHPAYTGTILLIVGIAINISLLTSAFMLFSATVIINYRIKKEEKMMIAFFGQDYLNYSYNTKKIIPFVF